MTLGAVFVVSLALAPVVAWRFQDLLEGGDASAGRTNSFVWRLFNFQQLLGVFLQSPIVGYGLRSAGDVNPVRTESVEGYERGFGAHSELIRVLVEQGVLGLLAYVAMVVILLSAIKGMCFGLPGGKRAELPEVGRSLYSFLLAAFVLAPIGADLLSGTAFLYVIVTIIGVLYMGRVPGNASSEESKLRTPAASKSIP